ncbi:MAG: calcium-binding protein [Terricaulis sp.]
MADPFGHSLMLGSVAFGTTTSTQFQTQSGGLIWTFTGSGFGGVVSGIPTTGTITGISVSGGASVTGISYSVATLRNGPEVGVMLAAIFAGNDTVNGDAYGDALTGYGGTNVLNGGDGDDLLQALGTNDTLDGGAGVDIVYLERTSGLGVTLNLSGMETLAGITLSDGTTIRNVERFNVTTAAGADVLTFSGDIQGSNIFNAGDGSDRIVIDISGSSLSWSQQFDRIVDQSGSNVVFMFGVEVFYITTGSGSDSLQGGSGNDRLIAGAGADYIVGGGGIDLIDGGDGIDFANIDRSATSVAITLNTGDLASGTGVTFADGSIVRNIEMFNFTAGSGADIFNVTVNPAISGLGPSQLNGGAGSDVLNISLANLTTSLNLMWSNIESVHATTGSGNDTLSGGSGNDELRSGAGNDLLSNGGGGIDLLDGEDGIDTANIDMSALTTPIDVAFADFATASGVTFTNGTIVRNVEIVRLTGGSGDDVLNLGSSILDGQSFIGGAGLDTVVGDFSSSNENVFISANGPAYTYLRYMTLNVDRVVFTGGSGEDTLLGSTVSGGADVLNGGAGNDSLSGYGGNDILNGGAGDDNIFMHAGADQIDGGSGTDRLVYRIEGDQLNVSQTLTLSMFVGMATAEGVTLANGTVLRNMETIEAELSNANDTVIVGANGLPSGSIHGREGIDTLEVNLASETRKIYLSYQPFFGSSLFYFDDVSSNFFFGSFERLVLTAGSADDLIVGLTGNDLISGGLGNDTLLGSWGADTVNGDDGNDTLYGFLLGSSGENPAADGADTLRGAGGDDWLHGGFGADVLDGGAGVDTASYAAALLGVVVNLAAPSANTNEAAGDTFIFIEAVDGSFFNDALTGDGGNNILFGGTGSDTLNGGAGADQLLGGDGDDFLYADVSDTLISGGNGTDWVYFIGAGNFTLDAGANGIEVVLAGAGNDTINAATQTAAFYTYAGGGADTVTGGSNNDNIYGQDGNDILSGGDGADLMMGESGADQLSGAGGDDTLWVDSQDTLISGGAGYDFVYFVGTGGLNLDAGASGLEWFFLGGDVDIINAATQTVGIVVYAGGGADTITGGAGTDVIFGQDGNDVLFGGALNDTLWGEAGADQITGGDGDDTLIIDVQDTLIIGGNGYDFVYFTGAGNFVIDAGAAGLEWLFSSGGNDTINAATQTTGIVVYAAGGGDTVTGGAGADVIFGQDGNDILVGGGQNDTLWGEAGADQLSGGDGDDTLIADIADTLVSGGNGYDFVYVTGAGNFSINAGASGVEWIRGLDGNDTLNGASHVTAFTAYGGNGADAITGGSTGDVLFGEGGDDIITGGAGGDVMIGGGGSDDFLFAAGWGSDLITDFQNGLDQFDMTALAGSGVTSIANLTITAQGADALISWNGNSILVQNAAGQIDSSDFIFGP